MSCVVRLTRVQYTKDEAVGRQQIMFFIPSAQEAVVSVDVSSERQWSNTPLLISAHLAAAINAACVPLSNIIQQSDSPSQRHTGVR